MRILNLKKLLCLFSMFVLVQTGFAQKTGKKELNQDLKQLHKSKNTFNWESFDQSEQASVKPDSAYLSGTWKAYNGLFNFNGTVNAMNLFKPFVIEINGNTIKRSATSSPVPFEVVDTKLLVKGEEKEEGFINMLTDKVLVISWKNGTNYTRYYYERSE